MKDEQYNQYIREQVKNSEDLYYSDIENNKEDVWDRIEERLEKKKVIPIWIYIAAASIILLISFGFMFNQKITNKNHEIALLKAQLQAKDVELSSISKTNYEVVKIIDTVKIVNEKVVYLPVKAYEKVVVHDTITNMVKVTDTVYIKNQKEKAKFVVNDINKEGQNNQQMLVNSNPIKKKKNRRFVFLFGKPKEETNQAENARLITLRTK
jgi:prefoldin subunit 5